MATKKVATTGKITRMQSILKLSGQGVRDKRAEFQYKKLTNSLTSKLRDLSDQKDDVTLRILSHIDLAPNSKDSLKVANIDADSWLTELAELYAEEVEIDESAAIYGQIKADFFTKRTAEELTAIEEETSFETEDEEEDQE